MDEKHCGFSYSNFKYVIKISRYIFQRGKGWLTVFHLKSWQKLGCILMSRKQSIFLNSKLIIFFQLKLTVDTKKWKLSILLKIRKCTLCNGDFENGFFVISFQQLNIFLSWNLITPPSGIEYCIVSFDTLGGVQFGTIRNTF